MKKAINILTIDGGGIRGLISSEIMIYIENKLSELYGKDIKLAEHFDYIAGTSTGGILTCLYVFPGDDGKPKYSAKDASNLYYEHGRDIFKKRFKWFYSLGGLFSYRYNEKFIEKLFKKYFSDKRIKESVVPFMLTSVDTNSRDLYLFKSYKAEKHPKHNKTYLKAARATSAASTYFKPVKMYIDHGKDIQEMSLIDGGFGINNPAISAYVEVKKLYPNAEKINILSLGTGPDESSHPYKKAKKWGIINGASKLFSLILTSMSDATDYQVSKIYENKNIGTYLRIQPNAYDASTKMDDASKKNLGLLREAGQKSVIDFKDQIDEFLEKTINKH